MTRPSVLVVVLSRIILVDIFVALGYKTGSFCAPQNLVFLGLFEYLTTKCLLKMYVDVAENLFVFGKCFLSPEYGVKCDTELRYNKLININRVRLTGLVTFCVETAFYNRLLKEI
jgi:hypothetical protein